MGRYDGVDRSMMVWSGLRWYRKVYDGMVRSRSIPMDLQYVIHHLVKQWAAVSTKSGAIRTPPQVWWPWKWRDTCQGHWPSSAIAPPMILELDLGWPHSTSRGERRVRKVIIPWWHNVQECVSVICGTIGLVGSSAYRHTGERPPSAQDRKR